MRCIISFNVDFTSSDNRIRQQLLPLVDAVDAFRATASWWLAPQLKLLIFRTSILDTTDITASFALHDDVAMFCCCIFRSIYHRFTRSRWNSRALSSGDSIEATFSNARQHSLWERARCCYRRHRGGGRGHVYQSATHALRQLLPVLKMSRTDTTNSSSVNRDCFVTFRRTSGYVLWR